MDTDDLKNLTPQQIDQVLAKLSIQKELVLEEALYSKDPQEIFKAQQYLATQKAKMQQGVTRAFMFDPYQSDYHGQGYKREYKKVSFDVLKRMGEIHIAKMVKNTRIGQVKNFLNFTIDDKKEGFTIRRKIGLFEERSKNQSSEEKKEIERIVKFLENSKHYDEEMKKKSAINFDHSKWDIFDDFDDFVAQIIDDSLTYDQICFELQRNRKFELLSYKAIDASTVRILDTIDPRYWKQGEQLYDVVNGFLPRYAQVWGTEIQRNFATNEPIVWYPWELAFATRNKSTDLWKNGYGTSELETLINIMTFILYGMDYNGNFFKNGSNPKGFVNIKSETSQDNLNDFRETFRSLMTGVKNTHKIPVFSGIDLEWIDMQQSNKDMEFQMWTEFLIIMFCAVYSIDPSELGFNFQKAAQMFGQDGQKQRLEHSKNKGLKPILMFLQKVISKYIVSEINPDYEFAFTGVDLEDEAVKIAIDAQKLTAGVVSMEDMFLQYNGRPFNKKKDTLLNQVYLQIKSMDSMGGNEEMGDMVEDETGGEGDQNPFDQFARGEESNPILKESLKYIRDNFEVGRSS